MNTKEIRNWLVIIGLASVGLTIWIFMAQPKQAEIEKAVRPLPILPAKSVLNDQFLQELQKRDVNGPVPVPANPANPPRSDPFT